jgi:hypothetical protein
MKLDDLFDVVLSWENFKDWLSGEIHISHWALHAVIGIPLLLIFSRLMRRPITSPVLLLPVAGLELINELLDYLRDFVPGWVWNYPATAIEVALTLVPPAILILLARARERWKA